MYYLSSFSLPGKVAGRRCFYLCCIEEAIIVSSSGEEQLCKSCHNRGASKSSQHEKVLSVTGDGIIQSPDFPNTYPRNTVIVWRLVAVTESSRIQLTFDPSFGLEDAEDGICKQSEPEAPAVMPAWMQSVDVLSEAVAGFSTMEEVMKYLEPERWQVDMEDLYKPTWQVVGKSFIHQKKSRVDLNLLREEVRLYSCTPRNLSVSLREELKRTDAIFWPSCLLVKRCGGNCACCSLNCYDCQCSPTKVAKKYHEVYSKEQKAFCYTLYFIYGVSFTNNCICITPPKCSRKERRHNFIVAATATAML
uniref:Platelet-derived growth factor C n=1 Tax=Sinocyclocheilus grahami TaxID=75366 RepID=A0A672MTK2_SINGR